jgi:hypothetical protein
VNFAAKFRDAKVSPAPNCRYLIYSEIPKPGYWTLVQWRKERSGHALREIEFPDFLISCARPSLGSTRRDAKAAKKLSVNSASHGLFAVAIFSCQITGLSRSIGNNSFAGAHTAVVSGLVTERKPHGETDKGEAD